MIDKKWLISRRALLGGVGASLLAQLARPRSALAQAMAQPKRFIYMFSPNGTIPEAHFPTGTETGFTLGRILEPLAPHRSRLLILRGIRYWSSTSGIGDGHQKGMCHMLTAVDLMPGPFPGGGNAGPAGYAGGPSVDQVIARALPMRPGAFRSLEFGVQCGRSDNWGRMVYAGADMPMPPMEDPVAAYTRIFGSVVGPDPAVLRSLQRRRSALDNAIAEINALNGRLGAEDRRRLAQYHDALRDIERRLSTMTTGPACMPPMRPPTGLNPTQDAGYQTIGRLHLDMMVAAMACDLTRVATMQWNRSVGGHLFNSLSATEGHHSYSHNSDQAPVRSILVETNRWYAGQLKYLLDKLTMVSENGGTMLDNTIVVWGNELGEGRAHSMTEIPFVIAGNAGGYFRTGRYLQYDGRATNYSASHQNMWVSVMNAMGLPNTTFGNPRFCTGPLANLR